MHSATKEEEEIYRETERIYREIIAICSEFKRGIENAGAIGDEEEGVDADGGGRGREGERGAFFCKHG